MVKDRSQGGSVTCWRCSIHNRHVNCLATVCQEEDVFIRGPHDHLHPAEPGTATSLQTRKKINSIVFISAFEIAEKVMAENVGREPPTLFSSVQLAQNANCL